MTVKRLTKQIVRGVECRRCHDQIWSKYTHDFHYCKCGYTFVDGGKDYLRYGWGRSNLPDDPDDLDVVQHGTPLIVEFEVEVEADRKFCYQCDEQTTYLFSDGRCNKCTRDDPDVVQGLKTKEVDHE